MNDMTRPEAGGEVRSMASTALRAPGSRRPARPLEPVLTTAWVLVLAAVVFAAWSGWSWLSAPRVSADAQARDQALRAGQQAVLNLNTLDYRRAGQDLRLWEQSSTGSLHREIATGLAAFEHQIRQAQTVSTGRILDAALSGMNARSGTARIIVALQITVTPAHGAAAIKQSRLAGTLTRTRSGWKLSALAPVPVGAATRTAG
jgi:Mce-associated membrane protein